jgi:lysylphosphatidylglycerol synthetase-like protein (DUF2156 family)
LSKRSVEFFKGEARKHNTQYQRMIRRLLDAYAEHHSRPGDYRATYDFLLDFHPEMPGVFVATAGGSSRPRLL